jgi:hypothetical protein
MKAQAEYIDLTGADMMTRPIRCQTPKGVKACVVVEKNNVRYGVVFDEKGEYAIYKIEGDTMTLLWSRDAT